MFCEQLKMQIQYHCILNNNEIIRQIIGLYLVALSGEMANH